MNRLLYFLLICWLGQSISAFAQTLPKSLAHAAKEHGVHLDQLGLYVHFVDEARPRLVYNMDRPMNPASTMKLVTTGAALHFLGPAFTWRTQALVDGTQYNDTLTGNLILKGGGDPKLTLEEFWLLLRQIRARGLRHIQGNLQLDRSLFEITKGKPEDFDGDGLRPYNALPDALLVNFNAVRLDFTPRQDSPVVDIRMHPALPQIQITNALQAVEGACNDWPQDPSLAGEPAHLKFSGRFPRNCGDTNRNYSPLSASAYVDALFRLLWTELGGTLSGQTIEGLSAPSARLIASQESEPLSEVIRDINKFSNNVMARQLFLSMGVSEGTQSVGLSHAQRAVTGWLASKGKNWPEFHLENGSGLSRAERISPRHLGEFLISMAKSPLAAEFIASLPLSGIDGTMRKRLNDSPVAGRAHIKTGYLHDVRASAGYVQSNNDRQAVIVCIVNGASAPESKPFHDKLIEWVYDQADARGCCQRAR